MVAGFNKPTDGEVRKRSAYPAGSGSHGSFPELLSSTLDDRL